MTVTERTLEDNDVEIDNLLHKILRSQENITKLMRQVQRHSEDGYVHERSKMILTLSETIKALAEHADAIDLQDEEDIKIFEDAIRKRIDIAITDIKDVEWFLSR
ncbi:hypothetical protein GOV11_00460 [Candidatus Woesearchaeota archaeon]|nr:hypothetical protein [Candidatus Woesearchaeota archaeon]